MTLSRLQSRRRLLQGLAALAAAGGGAPALAVASDRPQMLGAVTRHAVAARETLHDIARAYDVGFVELRAANPGVDAWAPPEGFPLLIPNAHLLPYDAGHRIVVNIADMRLYYFERDGGGVRSWPVGIGRDAHETPLGVLPVTERRKDPVWVPTPEMRAEAPNLPAAVPPGPNNPLGDYAIRVGWDGVNIHGTNKPDGVGRRLSRGCVRLYPEDIETLFELVELGDEVRIADEPAKFGWVDGELFMEVHPFGPDADEIEMGRPIDPEPLPYLDSYVAYAAGPELHRVDWTQVRLLERTRSGVPGQISV
jgi:L,D-transpeptidase ErfK/SrfK